MKDEKLFYQMYKAIERCFCSGTDKHSYKKSNAKKVKIFSYGDRRNIIKVANQLCNFVEENYPEINLIKEIKNDHINEFFIKKAQYCSQNTLKNYKYCINKLEKMIKQELHIKVNYMSAFKMPNGNNILLRDVELKEEHLEVLLEELERSSSKAVLGIKVAKEFGLRVSEVCKLQGRDIDLVNGILYIADSKGKRSRKIKIKTLEQIELCKNIKINIGEMSRVCPIREDSVNCLIKRILIKNNITTYRNKKTGVHAIRKHYAKKDYINNLKENDSEEKSWAKTSINLGHSSNRKVLKNTYVKY